MPTYSYACSACGHRFDIYQAFTDEALTACPECGGTLRKQFGNVGVVFKGSGFYRNDARGKKPSESSSGSSESSGSKGSGSGGGSDSKAAPAKESTAAPAPSSSGESSKKSGSSSAKPP